MGIKEMIGGVGLTILFIISMVYFMTAFIQTNNPDGFNPDIGGLNTSLSSLNKQAQQLQSVGEDVKNTLESEKPSSVYLFLIIESAWKIPIAFISFLISGIFSIVTITFTSLFGIGSSAFYIVFVVINGLLMIAIVLAVLKAIRLGQTER